MPQENLLKPIQLPSVADVVYDVLRKQILHGHLIPDQQINLAQLEAELDVSRTPLKVALARLQAEGLVTIHARRGTYITRFSERDIRECFELRIALEAQSLRLTFASHNAVLRRDIVALFERMTPYFAADSTWLDELMDFMDMDRMVHLRIIQLSSNERMLQAYENANVQGYIAVMGASFAYHDVLKTQREHQQMLLALQQEDLPLLLSAARTHLEAACDRAIVRLVRVGGEQVSRLPVVVGVGLTPFAANRADCTVRDLVVEAVLACTADAGLTDLNAIQHGLTSYESDHFNCQMTLGAILHDTLGLIPTPNVRVEGGGATGALALRTAWAYLQSGLCDSILVYGGETNGRSVTSQTANALFALSADADWEMMVGGTYTAFYAAMMRAHMTTYATTEAQFAHVAVRNRRNAQHNPFAQKPMDLTIDDVLASKPIAEPYKLLDCSLLSDGAAAILLATEDWARAHSPSFSQRPIVYYAATGCGTDTMRLGDRYPELCHFRGKQVAAQQAYAKLGITHPLDEIDVAELYDSYSGVEIQAVEDLAFVPKGEGGSSIAGGLFDLGGTLPVNTSGGLLGRGAPVGATGIAQAVEIAQQLWGVVSPERQVADARRGLTDTHAGIGSICVVNIFERRD